MGFSCPPADPSVTWGWQAGSPFTQRHQYLRYSGALSSGWWPARRGRVAYVALRGERGRYVAAPACEHVFIWDTRKAEKVLVLKGRKQEVTALCPSPDDLHLSVGYEDGSVRVFSLLSGEEEITFNGHKGTVTALRYDALGGKLASGSKDTDIIVWDVINESGLYRLKGHKDAITQLLFFSEKNVLISSGKDTLVKWWDLDTQHCFKTLVGHRSEVWGLALVSQESLLITGSADSELRAWNISFFQEHLSSKIGIYMCYFIPRSTLQCIRTMVCEYALCSFFVPGDRQVIIGTKTGKLQLFDLASGNLLESIDAHNGALWSISLSSDQRGFVTGGADKCVKFWEFQLVKDENSIQKWLSVKQTRVLQLDEDVLCVRYSPCQKLLAVALLDCTVKIFYTDTLKFFLSLYGHKLPVLCMDISHDGALIATGSADRNVKIWGLDFGDCHRSLFAHDDSIMYLQFVSKSHLFFTAGKDHKIKQWDADKFEHIQTLEGHHQEVWCLALSPNGDYLVSSSHDKSLRLWERTREPLILEEEREMQREMEYEDSIAKEDQPLIAGDVQGESGLAGKKTIETIKAAERIMEAIELYREETVKMEEHKAICRAAAKEVPLPVNPVLQAFGNISPSAYVLEVLKKVKSSELEESLLVLPFSYVPDLLVLFNEYLQLGSEIELLCRALLFLLRIHFGQITSNQLLVKVMENLKKTTKSQVSEVRDTLGFNMVALQVLKREIEAKDEVTFFADATAQFEERKRKRKKKQKMILAMV
ncbi:WD repeat-containing protein 3 [Sceloporus undulatus]|uniref:WD repeat-containing protein 3 n=1 Tax=Sceloporus undulatus TaxID=8520 RepID=UPI001C4BD734|nr:WD repeat-containing protein 3 [Sceloporus undulatus]